MKTIHLLSVLALAAASSAFAATSTERPAALQVPVPVTVVHPADLPDAYVNYNTSVVFILDKNGYPHDVRPAGTMPQDLQERLLPAVAKWTFKPATDASGKPVERRVILPLTLVDSPI